MPWRVDIPLEASLVETTYSGVLTPPELSDAVRETLRVAETSGLKRFLADCTSLEGGHSILDLYALVDSIAKDATGIDKEAVLLPSLPAAAEDVRFWETACFNRGLNVRVFVDRESAREWLLSP